MSRNPIRMLDDDQCSGPLRDDLRAAGGDTSAKYDVDAGLARFSALLASGAATAGAVASAKAVSTASAAAKGATTAKAASTVGGTAAKGSATMKAVSTASGAAVKGAAAAGGAAAGGVATATVVGAVLALGVLGAVFLVGDPSKRSELVGTSEVGKTISGGSASAPIDNPTVLPPADIASAATTMPELSSAPIPASSLAVPDERMHATPPPVSSVARTPSSEPGHALQEEMADLAALRAVARTSPATAVDLANEGNARFPKGVFWQEREVVAITSLAALGRRDEARARAKSLLDRHPETPFAETLRRATGLDP